MAAFHVFVLFLGDVIGDDEDVYACTTHVSTIPSSCILRDLSEDELITLSLKVNDSDECGKAECEYHDSIN